MTLTYRTIRLGLVTGLASIALLVSSAAPVSAARASGSDAHRAEVATPLTAVRATSDATSVPAHFPIVVTEMSIQLGWTFVPAGPVVFDIRNIGTVIHEVVVIRTDLAPGAIPRDPSDPSRVRETGSVGEADAIAPGTSASLPLTLAPGHYVLICNQPGHYAAGMHTGFTAVTYVNATLKEMSITLDKTSVPYGPVVFSVTNAGSVTHELVILRTGVLPENVPLGGDGRADESTDIGEVNDVAPGHFSGGLFDLGIGEYVLICNQPGHFVAGMRTRFQVTAAPVSVTLKEMSIQLDRATVPAGLVDFYVSNAGTITHELVVLHTSAPDGQLPPSTGEAGKVSERGWVGETGDMAAGSFNGLELYLPAGTYAVICNQPGHYAAGMHLILTVQ